MEMKNNYLFINIMELIKRNSILLSIPDEEAGLRGGKGKRQNAFGPGF